MLVVYSFKGIALLTEVYILVCFMKAGGRGKMGG
jgi:hypothetical protein